MMIQFRMHLGQFWLKTPVLMEKEGRIAEISGNVLVYVTGQ